MKVVVFLLLFAGFLVLFYRMAFFRELLEMLRRSREGMNASVRQRSLSDRKKLLDLQDKRTSWYFLEQQLYYSGLKVRFPGITAEWWAAWNCVGLALVFCVIAPFGGLAMGFLACLFLLMAEGLLLKQMKKSNLRKVEKNLMEMLDFLGNYSMTAGEVTGVLYQISRFMEEPLKTVLLTCYYEASTSGDTGKALVSMAEKIEHPKFKELVRNMDISVRYSADFSALVSGSRRSMREYLRATEERRVLYREAIINMVLLLVMSVTVLLAVGKLTGTSIAYVLTKTLPGRAGIVVLIGIFALFRRQMGKEG